MKFTLSAATLACVISAKAGCEDPYADVKKDFRKQVHRQPRDNDIPTYVAAELYGNTYCIENAEAWGDYCEKPGKFGDHSISGSCDAWYARESNACLSTVLKKWSNTLNCVNLTCS